MLRFVLGNDALPVLPFAAPDAPDWRPSQASIVLTRQGGRFSLEDGGARILSGAATTQPYTIEIDTGSADVFGFGAATGAADRNGARFRIVTRDTLFYGIAGASYTAMPFFIARDGSRAVGVLAATTYPLDVAVTDGKVSLVAACDTDGTPVDVIVLRGSIVEIVADLASLVGRTFLPPAWALGFHQSRWSYRTSSAVIDIARRFRALDLLRKEKRGARVPETVLVEPDPAPAVHDRERALRAIGTLPDEQREVVFLTFYEGLSYGEIAGMLGIPEGTVKSRMYYARRSLAEALA